MDRYQDYMREAVQCAEKGDWKRMMLYAKMVPASWDVWQQLPSAARGGDSQGPGLADEAIGMILNHLQSNPRLSEELLPGFLFEMASNLPDTAGASVVNRIADLGKEDGFVTSRVKEHPSYKPDMKMEALQGVAKFWHDYERQVTGDHFAMIRSLHTNRPEEFTDHRGTAGSSSKYEHLRPHFAEYAKAAQLAVAKTAAEDRANSYKDMRTETDKAVGSGYPPIHMKYIKGQPHVLVYRGVGGNFAESIRRAIRLNESTGEADQKRLVLPHTGHFSSWSASKEIATSFAHRRGTVGLEAVGTLDHTPKRKGMVIEKWMPLKHLLHSGFHTVVFDQDHAHQNENELIFAHPDGKLHIATANLHFVTPKNEWSATSAPVVPRPMAMRKSEPLTLDGDMSPEEQRLHEILAGMKRGD